LAGCPFARPSLLHFKYRAKLPESMRDGDGLSSCPVVPLARCAYVGLASS